MSYIQLPYGYVGNNKQVQSNLPSDYEESQHYKKVPYLRNQNPAVENKLLNLLRNREDLKKWLLAISDFGNEIQGFRLKRSGYFSQSKSHNCYL